MMMNKAVLMVVAAMLSLSGARAQSLSVHPRHLDAPRGTIEAPQKKAQTADNQVWWGYMTEGAQRSALGTGKAETVNQAIYIPATNDIVVGNTIKGVRFYLRNTTNIKDLKLWISTTLPSNADEADKLVLELEPNRMNGGDEGSSKLGLLNEVTLRNPYPVTSAIYVGYSYTVTALNNETKYPIVTSYENGEANSLLISSTSNPNWMAYGDEYGPLAMQLLIEGDMKSCAAAPVKASDVSLLLGGQGESLVEVLNSGAEGISSIDYTLTDNGTTSDEQHLNLERAFTQLGKSTVIRIPVSASESPVYSERTLTITRVNGQPNEATNKSTAIHVYTIARATKRGIAVEEFTGTGCGWCPRGLTGMEKMRHQFGDSFVGIGVHGYNSGDPMYFRYTTSYCPGIFSGSAPCCQMNRFYGEIDPYYGTGIDIIDDFNEQLAIPAKAALTINGTWNDAKTAVNATATVESLIDGETYTIEYMLIADSLTGDAAVWKQSNYYSSGYSGQTGISKNSLPSDLQFLWTAGTSYKPIFNDVLIATSYVSKKNKATAIGSLDNGQSTENSYTLSLPTTTTLKNAIDKKNVAVVALLIDSQGAVANAAKFYLSDNDASGIDNVSSRMLQNTVRATYSIDGRRVSDAHKGLSIMRMADGSTRKVITK